MDLKTCPLPLVSDMSRTILSLHKHYQNGCFPYSGGLFDQPNLYIQAMELL
jgi:hypothetical protein